MALSKRVQKELEADFTVEQPTDKDREQLLTLLREGFVYEEPLNKAINLTWQDCEDYYQDQVRECISNGTSVIVRETTNSVIVACALNKIAMTLERLVPEPENGYSEKIIKMNNLIDLLRSAMTKALPIGSRYFEIITLCVHPKFYRKGLARQATEKSVSLAIQWKCDYIISVASNIASQTLFSKLQFQDVTSIDLKTYKPDGTIMFPHTGNTKECKLMYRPAIVQ
ncbi:Acetyltransf 1 domain containing protein [Trichuris trichiura]|uniref:Acetyltransf 1 domain containing protein n=1 Tax=Trichuris trichiura TaxID=36087 RepID=A0A077YZL8_TRITR|nr:Acetyltransf 1 domain containing protein [Trichuris trichiura]